MQGKEYTVRTMTREDVDIAVEWAALEGWNPGLEDADCFFGADNTGFLIGLLGNEPIATISVVKYGMSFGFLGFYIVKPEYRGRGYGLKIWNEGMKSLDGRNIGLDGVVEQQDNYKKSGFKLAYRNIRYEGKGGGAVPDGLNIVPLSTLEIKKIISYDTPFFPDIRETFLRMWLSQPGAFTMGLIHNEGLAGYGMMRKCRSGFKIGPLFADNKEFAEALFLSLKAKAKDNAPVFLDTPEINPEAVALAECYGMQVVFETARMYTGKTPDIPIEKTFGVTTFELG